MYFSFPLSPPFLVPFKAGAACGALGLQTVPRLWISVGASNDRDHSRTDWHTFFRVNNKVDSPMLIPIQARSDTIRTAHVKVPGDMLALSTSFKLMLRAGCFVLTGSNKIRRIRPPTGILVLLIRQCYGVLHDPSAHCVCWSRAIIGVRGRIFCGTQTLDGTTVVKKPADVVLQLRHILFLC